MYDAVIIGGGPAGLSAALILGRCGRRTLVIDSGEPRNAASPGLHGFLTRDGTPPLELRELGRAGLAAYPTVAYREGLVTDVRREREGFTLEAENIPAVQTRLLLLATGRVDRVPEKPGFQQFYGRGVYHCPICDGWEHRDRPLVAYGNGNGTVELAIELRTWSAQVTLCSDGPAEWDRAGSERLATAGVAVDSRPVSHLEGDQNLRSVCFADRSQRQTDALFFCGDCVQKSSLPERLGCQLKEDGAVHCAQHAATNVPGLFVAGNVRGGVHLAITAAAEGAEAALAMNEALIDLNLYWRGAA